MSDYHSRVCSYLGLLGDATTHMGFPSCENHCFASSPHKSPDVSHQNSFCLQRSYDRCDVYRNIGGQTQSRNLYKPRQTSRLPKVKYLAALISSSVLILVGFWLVRRGLPVLRVNGLAPNGNVTVPTLEETAAQASFTVSPLNPLTPTQFSIATVTQPSVQIATPVNPHRLEVTKVVAGTGHNYLVHVVAVGETLDIIADDYGTTVEAILAVNYRLKPPVWVDYLLVIPVGIKDVTGLPALDVYVVDEYESIASTSLAEELEVDEAALEYFNVCTDNCEFHRGDILLVPHMP